MSRADRQGKAWHGRGRDALHSSPRDSLLVVSDHMAFRLSVALTLDAVGYRAEHDALGLHVLRYLRPHTSRHQSVVPMEAVVLDISSEPTRGLALLAALRVQEPELPIVVIAPAFDAGLYSQIASFEPAVVFEGPVSVETVVTTTMNLLDHAFDTLQLAG